MPKERDDVALQKARNNFCDYMSCYNMMKELRELESAEAPTEDEIDKYEKKLWKSARDYLEVALVTGEDELKEAQEYVKACCPLLTT